MPTPADRVRHLRSGSSAARLSGFGAVGASSGEVAWVQNPSRHGLQAPGARRMAPAMYSGHGGAPSEGRGAAAFLA